MNQYKNLLKRKPQALIVHSFLGAIFIGTLLLMLPIATTSGSPLRAIDAFFMATSATCVTGLSLFNIGQDFSFFGQIVILLLIQLGGLGIMTFSLFFLILLGKKLSLSSCDCVETMITDANAHTIGKIIIKIFWFTLAVESLGAMLLFAYFLFSKLSPLQAGYHAIFHAISAFCNAGFSLYQDSFMKFQNNYFVQGVLMGLIVLGGIGFAVINDVGSALVKNKQRFISHLSLHSKITVLATVSLLFLGTLAIWSFEKNNILASLSLPQQFLNAAFLSVTSRTAGFNTIPTNMLSNVTLLFVICLMFIGGCSGSTAGGIKVTTFSVLGCFFVSRLEGSSMTHIFRRKIPDEIVSRSMIILSLSFFLILTAVFALQISEHQLYDLVGGKNFLDFLFEVVSAFGTVGLSTGITGGMSDIGKFIIGVCMFTGRIGPLTLGIALQLRSKRKLHLEYPQEEILVG